MTRNRISSKYAVMTPTSVLLWAGVLLAAAVLYAVNIWMGGLNQDEGWYLYGARLVSQGRLPYRDFAFTQGPVMPFVYSLAQPLVDRWGVLGGRVFTAVLGLMGILCSAMLAYRLSAPRRKSAVLNRQSCTALLTVILVGLNAYQVYFSSVVKTYSLTSFLLVMGFLLLSYADGRMGWLWSFCSGMMFALAAGVRTSTGIVIPLVFLLLLGCYYYARKVRIHEYDEHDTKRENILPAHIIAPIQPFGRLSVAMAFAVGAGLTLCVVYMPFLFLAPEGLRFGLLEYHAGREVGGIMSVLMLKGGSVMRLLGAYFVAFSILVAVSLYILFHRDTFYPAPVPKYMCVLVLVAGSAAAVWLVQLLAPFPYDEYQVNIFPLFAVVLAAYLSWVSAPELLNICTAVFFLSVAAVVSSPVINNWLVRDIDRLWVRMREEPPIVVLQRVGRNVRELTGGDEELLTQDTYIAVEAGLDVPHGLEMGPFSYVPGWSRGKAEACNVVNREMLVEIIERAEAPVAAFSGYGLSVEAPAVVELPEIEQYFLHETLERRYRPFREIEHFGQADTTLKIYVRK